MMTRDELRRYPQQAVASYESEEFPVPDGDGLHYITTTVEIYAHGVLGATDADSQGWALFSRDDADGPTDECPTDVYATIEEACEAARVYAEERGGGSLPTTLLPPRPAARPAPTS